MSAAPLLHPLRKQAPSASPALPKRVGPGGSGSAAFVSRGPGEALAADTRRSMEQCFGHDLSEVRVHAGRDAAVAARAMGAEAFASGTHIGFAHGRYDPHGGRGRALLAHELAHVVQQAGTGAAPAAGRPASLEAEADAAAEAVSRGAPAPALSATAPGLQRRVEFRAAGPGPQSGHHRIPELIALLNFVSTGLVFSVDGAGVLSYAAKPGGVESDFDRKMENFVDQPAVLPMRLTTREGLVRSTPGGRYDTLIDADSWRTGFVDVDDLLASDDLGFQLVLVHFLTERLRTRNYDRRLRSARDPLVRGSPEFDRAHSRGVTAEVELLRDFFDDPSIRLREDGGSHGVFRRYRTSRGDTIRARTPSAPRGQRGLQANLMDVRLRDGTIMDVYDYRRLLERERAARAAPPAAPAAAPAAGAGPPP